jgi:hypothetical protein
MPEQTINADGFIQALVSMGGQMECIASEEKHPKPEIAEEDKLKRAIQEMLVENTGCSILDSGGASYLTNFLEMTEESKRLDKLLQKAIDLGDTDNYMADMEDFMEEQGQDGYTHYSITNTYNYDNILSEALQYGILISEDTDEHFIILQLHNGCDVRGGYTRPRVFSLGTDDEFSYFRMAQEEVTAICRKCGIEWFSDDSGYNWYNDGNPSEQSELRTDTKQEEELKIVCDAKNNKVYHKNCGGEISYEVLEEW